MASYLSRTFGTATSTKKFTVSLWVKGTLSSGIILQYGNDYLHFNNNSIDFEPSIGRLRTNRLFRDPASWFHIMVVCDTTLSTADDRFKIYVNGVQETSFASRINPSVNADFTGFNTAVVHKIGQRQASPANDLNYTDLMTHFHFVDGLALTPTTFGESDSVSGIWKPKTAPSISEYGVNGFFLKFENSGAMGTDSSGKGNNFTVSGTITQNVDTPSNNFATINPLDNYHQGSIFSNGNNTFLTADVSTTYNTSSIMVNAGKWYVECKVVSGGATTDIGIVGEMADATVGEIKAKEFGYSYVSNGEFGNNGSASSYGSSYANGDIIGIALDCTNNKLYFSKNGTFQDSGNPSAGSGGKTITAPASTPIGNYAFAGGDKNSDVKTFSFNFGNGYFGTTVVASAGTSPSGGGIFEYDCPSGYQALCTKGLNSF